MNKVYNTQKDITSNLEDILLKIFPDIRKTQLNIIPAIIFGMLKSESLVASDIAKVLKNEFSLVQIDSIIKRIRRLFKNDLFDPYDFYNTIISYVIDNFGNCHTDNRVHIIFDHMFSHDNYTVFAISMRIGKQGIPIYFKCFEGKEDPTAFVDQTIIDGIKTVHKLFKNRNSKLIFLADRWFNSEEVLKTIDDLGHTYCVRLKGNLCVKYFDKKEGHYLRVKTGDLFSYRYKSIFYNNIFLFDDADYKTNIVISKSVGVSEPWIVCTNGNGTRAIKDYGYRFGGIECIFKNQKSNGFYIENTVNASLKYFESMYAFACFGVLFMTILGAEYSKNTKCYRHIKITTHKFSNGIKTRVLSLFNTGLTLFNIAFNSLKYVRLPFSLILYDI